MNFDECFVSAGLLTVHESCNDLTAVILPPPVISFTIINMCYFKWHKQKLSIFGDEDRTFQ